MSDRVMSGKTVVVTGGTSGLGGEASRQLAALGASVVVVGRDATKGEQFVRDLRQRTQDSQVSFVKADLASLASVRSLSNQLKSKLPRLDVLINNAGGAFYKRAETSEGLELTLALNLLSPFLLTQELTPLLKASAPARVVNVVTKLFDNTKLDLDDLQSRRKYSSFRVYGGAKLGLMAVTYEQARRLKDQGITVNCVHPGVIPETNFGSDMPGLARAMGPFFAWLFGMKVTLEEGGAQAVYAASAPELKDVTGQYLIKHKPAKSPPLSYDLDFTRRLWAACEELTRRGGGAQAVA